MINKKAGFWIRAFSLLIDITIFCLLAISLSLWCLEKKYFPEINKYIYQIKNYYIYYLWFIIVDLILIIQFIFIPMLCDGKTIGMMITQLKVKYLEKDKSQSFVKRIEIGVVLWIFLITSFMCLVQPPAVNKMAVYSYIKTNYKDMTKEIEKLFDENKWSLMETILYSIPSTFSTIVLIVELFLLISVGFRNNKSGLVDKFSNSQIVYSKKYDIQKNNDDIKIINPKKDDKYKIIWRE